MSRVSISRRLQTLLKSAERMDPPAAAVHRMPPATRLRFDGWRARCDAITAQYPNGAALYEAILSNELVTPDPPRAVAEALGIERWAGADG